MNDFYSTLLVVIGSIAILIFILHNILFETIKKKSETYKNLKILNKKYKFDKNDLPKKIELFDKCTNKRAYDMANVDDYLQKAIQYDIVKFDKLIGRNETVYKQYRSYIKEYNTLLPEKLSNISTFKLKNIKSWIVNFYEQLIFKIYKLKPLRYTKVMVKISYRSPQGKNNYAKSHTFSYDGLKRHYDYVKKIIEQRLTRENLIRIERAKVTPSLRSFIFKRDNNTCQKCGATKDDGISLQVDHIIPVSKGGKTEPSNLQLLCDWCNLGKSDKDN